MNRKEALMKRLQIADFVLNEAALFLNSHPDCTEALDYYNKYLKLREETIAEYTKKYGTVTRTMLKNDDVWDWVNEDWPWKEE